MNLIFITLDSFRQDHIGVYHRGAAAFPNVAPCLTPALDKFAQSCILFDNAYPEGLPTMPVRYTLMTGQQTLPFRAWGPLLPGDVTISELLRREGYVCGIVSDCYHYRAPGMDYHRGFHSYNWVRGQEYDPYNSAPPQRSIDDYVNANYPDVWRQRVSQCLANLDRLQRGEDWFSAQVIGQSIDWLERNRCHKKTFLWIDSFDPHEPWFPPKRFDTYTSPDYSGKKLIMPMGGKASDWATEEEQDYIRGLYAGEATYVDYWLGKLFASLEQLGYLDDSVVVIVSDHGHPLGDHGKFLKGTDRLYSELLKVPFLVRLPGGQAGGRRRSSLIQFQDILPTVLDLIGLGSSTSAMHGRSFRAVLEGNTERHRGAIITGYHEGLDRCIRDERWSLIVRPAEEPDELYDLWDDPREQRNLIDEFPEEAKRLSAVFGSHFFRQARSSHLKGVQGKYELASATLD